MSLTHKPSPALCVALLALFVSLGGVGVAASGTDFILGRSNTAKAKTSLTAPVAGNSLQITNTLPGGSALGLSVDAASPPFTTNSSAKVPNLNSDLLDGQSSTAFLGVSGKASDSNRLDGLDSTGYVRGGGSITTMRATTSAPSNSFSQTVLGTFAGPSGAPFLQVTAYCADNYAPIGGVQNGAAIYLKNVTSSPILRWLDLGSGDPTVTVVNPGVIDDAMPVKVTAHTIWHGRTGTAPFTVDAWTNKVPNTCDYDVRLTIEPSP